MIDILFLSHNRAEYTEMALRCLIQNTAWDEVGRVFLYDDYSTDGTDAILRAAPIPGDRAVIIEHRFGSPVLVMRHYLEEILQPTDTSFLLGLASRGFGAELLEPRPDWFAKIDSDTCVPPGWLEACLDVVDRSYPDYYHLASELASDQQTGAHIPEVDFIGIEPMEENVPADWDLPVQGYQIRQARHIGGIGLMKVAAFDPPRDRLQANARYFGFSEWQHRNEDLLKGFIKPAIKVCLLDRVPIAPWSELSERYIRNGWQRGWAKYRPDQSALWEWLPK